MSEAEVIPLPKRCSYLGCERKAIRTSDPYVFEDDKYFHRACYERFNPDPPDDEAGFQTISADAA